MSQRIRVGTFNLFNLVLPDRKYYGHREYTRAEYNRKLGWIREQLGRMEADVVGFQEVFDEAALREALAVLPAYEDAAVVTGGADGDFPAVALVSRLPVVETQVYRDFPAAARIDFEGVELPPKAFARPVVRARVELPYGYLADVFVVHMKSKRPEVPEDADPHDPLERAKGKVRSLVIRAAEAAALRAILLETMAGRDRGVVVLGDANDSRDAVTTEIVTGTPPWRQMPREVKQKIWDTLLYDVKDARPRGRKRDVTYTHIHNGRHDSLDHVFVSQEFIKQNRRHLGVVEYVREFNDHLIDSTMYREPLPVWTSDHAQVVATLAIRAPRDGGRAV